MLIFGERHLRLANFFVRARHHLHRYPAIVNRLIQFLQVLVVVRHSYRLQRGMLSPVNTQICLRTLVKRRAAYRLTLRARSNPVCATPARVTSAIASPPAFASSALDLSRPRHACPRCSFRRYLLKGKRKGSNSRMSVQAAASVAGSGRTLGPPSTHATVVPP